MSIKIYITQWTVDKVRTNNMVTPQKKAHDTFLCSLQINIKKRARRGSVLQATCVLLKLQLFLNHLYPERSYFLILRKKLLSNYQQKLIMGIVSLAGRCLNHSDTRGLNRKILLLPLQFPLKQLSHVPGDAHFPQVALCASVKKHYSICWRNVFGSVVGRGRISTMMS